MKKIVLTLLLYSGLIAENYVGIEYGSAHNTTTQEYSTGVSNSIDNNYHDFKIKYGSGTDGGYKLQTALSLISFEKNLFDNNNNDLLEISFDLIKEIEITKEFYPFIKAGIAFGSMNVDGYSVNHIPTVSYNLGAGISYALDQRISLVAGVDWLNRKWLDIEYYDGYHSIVTIKTKDSAVKPYIGVNYAF